MIKSNNTSKTSEMLRNVTWMSGNITKKHRMTYKKYLEENGFKWNDEQGLYQKNIGFGMKVTVEMICKKLFEIKKNGTTLFSDFVETFDEFKSKMELV